MLQLATVNYFPAFCYKSYKIVDGYEYDQPMFFHLSQAEPSNTANGPYSSPLQVLSSTLNIFLKPPALKLKPFILRILKVSKKCKFSSRISAIFILSMSRIFLSLFFFDHQDVKVEKNSNKSRQMTSMLSKASSMVHRVNKSFN